MSYGFLANQIFLSDSGKGVVIKYRIYVLLPHHVFKQLWKPGSDFLQGPQGTQPTCAKEGEQDYHFIPSFTARACKKCIPLFQEAMKLHLTPLQSCSLICALQSLTHFNALMKAKSKEGKQSCEQGNQYMILHGRHCYDCKYSPMDKANKGRNVHSPFCYWLPKWLWSIPSPSLVKRKQC